MAVQLQRSIYINSVVLLQKAAGVRQLNIPAAGQLWNVAQSANFSLNIPRVDINAFGFDGVLDRPQLEAETATIETSWVAQTKASNLKLADVTGAMLNDMILESKAQIPEYITVTANGVGGVKQALMNSLTGEISVGALATMTGSFTGAQFDVANPQAVGIGGGAGAVFNDPPPANSPGSGAANATAIPGFTFGLALGQLVTPRDINLTLAEASAFSAAATQTLVDEGLEFQDGVLTGDATDADTITESCAQSASFSWDIPVEVVLCLGSDPTQDGLALGNPPGSSSITVEALSAQLSSDIIAQDYCFVMGAYNITVLGGRIDSRTHNLAVGDLYGTYNYVIGGTGDGFEIGNR